MDAAAPLPPPTPTTPRVVAGPPPPPAPGSWFATADVFFAPTLPFEKRTEGP